jgi:hypothetical protein
MSQNIELFINLLLLLYLDDRGSIFGRCKRLFSSSLSPTDSGAHSASFRIGTKDLSQEIKRPGSETCHLTLCSAGVKNGGAVTPLPYMPSGYSV